MKHRKKSHIALWEWSRLKRWFLEGNSYTTIAQRSGRSRSVIAAHGKKFKWQQHREALRAIWRTADTAKALRGLEFSEEILVEYIEKLNTAKVLERVQQAKLGLSE